MSLKSRIVMVVNPNIIVFVLLTFSKALCAGESSGLVSNLLVHEPGIIMFSAGNISGAPACNTKNQWAISLSDQMSKGFLGILLSAQAQGKKVFVKGYKNTCRDWGNRELPSYVILVD
jgi:hypothetical protein